MSKDKIPASVPSKIRERLYEKLKDPAYASAYVNEALLEGDEVVAGINRSTVFKTLRPETRTSFTTFHSLLHACDINFSTQPMLKTKTVTAKKKARTAVRR